ncbi:SDR family NAD(P)-dependent oxidoreductase [Streptosporangium saharense]|uniref:SDR family NAD(P)-dependent oxidoreductase n=1 Tax=Streptosporangium saharense TaxID=1706840 RepID=UPI003674022E
MGDYSDSLAGKGVIVTGGGTGIGRATAHLFAAEGARVLVVGRTTARLEETAAADPLISVFAADGAAADGPERIVEAAVRQLGRIDVLVNNAAIIRPAVLGSIDRRTAEEEIATNLLASLFLAQAALPHLTAAKGTIVNVSSNPPGIGWPGNSVYGSTKVALDFLTATWAVELGSRGVRVMSVAPGITDTPVLTHAGFTEEQIAASGEQLVRRIPLGRIAQPDEVARWIVNMARAEAGYLTGTVVRVDGGLSAFAG